MQRTQHDQEMGRLSRVNLTRSLAFPSSPDQQFLCLKPHERAIWRQVTDDREVELTRLAVAKTHPIWHKE